MIASSGSSDANSTPEALANVMPITQAQRRTVTALVPERFSSSGLSTIALAEHATVVVGIDASPAMLRVAPVKADVSYLLAGAEKLPLPAASLDAVTCCSGVHWFDQQRFFSELRRVLRPDGWVGLYDHYFLGEMVDVPAFADWTRDALESRRERA